MITLSPGGDYLGPLDYECFRIGYPATPPANAKRGKR